MRTLKPGIKANKDRQKSRVNYWKHREEKRAYSKEWYASEDGRAWTKSYRALHKEELNEMAIRANRRLHIEVLEHYSNGTMRCSCPGCNENHLEFLTIEHPNGGGNEQKRKYNIFGGIRFYQWLKNNNFPPGYKVICMNCNFSIGKYDYCPHEEKREWPEKYEAIKYPETKREGERQAIIKAIKDAADNGVSFIAADTLN